MLLNTISRCLLKVNKNLINFKQTIKRLQLGHTSGLCYVVDLKDRKATLTDEERIHLLKARDLDATAVFFRKFQDRPSLPQAYIYDHTEKEFSLEEKGKLHKFIWNSGVVPIFILFQKTKIEIYNATKKVVLDNERKPKAPAPEIFEETIGLAATTQKILNLFSSLQNGTFWDESKNQKFIDTESAYSSLLKELKTARIDFIKEIKLPEKLANKLLLIAILIKYLEERTGADNKPILYFKKYDSAKDFCQVIEKNKFLDLLNDLSEQMNGKVFELSSEEYKILKKANLKPLVEFLSAKKDGNQYVLWSLYSFNHLPVELISGIYEEFLPEEKGTIYTPLLLVQLLIDQSMPLNKPQPDLKVLDPACGSGIFLVSAFKRKVEWWKIENYKKTGEFKNPDKNTLKKILRESIFGVDIKEEAVKIAVFSLSIALCDYLEPTKIWAELRFDDLSEKNLLVKNFFVFLNENKSSDFDLVIGNPPFKNFDTDEARDKEALKIHNKEKEQNELTSPGKQIALLFLKYSMNFLKPNGMLCLVMPSTPLLYNNTLEYRNRNIFEKYNVPQILDFTFLSPSLFSKKDGNNANVGTAVIFVQNKIPDEKDILHVVIRNTVVANKKLYFEIDTYDFHYVSKEIAKTKDWIWKVNLLGGGSIYELVDRLKGLPTLNSFLNNKIKKHNWFFREGYQPASKESDRPIKLNFITGKKVLLPEAILENGEVDETKSFIEKSEFFHRIQNPNLYLGPQILIHQIIGGKQIKIAFSKKGYLFKESIIGIHSPQEDYSELEKIFNRFKKANDLYRFFLICTSGHLLVARTKTTELKKVNIESLPYPEKDKDLAISKLEEILVEDVLKFYSRLGGYDSTLDNPVEEKELFEFGNLLCEILNSVYEKNKKKFQQHKIIITPSFICNSFQYSSSALPRKETIEKSDKLENELEILIRQKVSSSARVNRIIRFYHENKFYLIKPRNYRFWLKSIAIKDADEILMDLIEAGY